MKKFFATCIFSLSTVFILQSASFADTANWWGEYCNSKNNVCIYINNLGVNKMGIWSFKASFSRSEGNEICDATAFFEKEGSRQANFMFYSFNLSPDDNTLNISRDTEVVVNEEDGCTTALFGVYKRKE